MNEMDMVRDLVAGDGLAGADEFGPARGQLATAIATEISAARDPGTAGQRPHLVGVAGSSPPGGARPGGTAPGGTAPGGTAPGRTSPGGTWPGGGSGGRPVRPGRRIVLAGVAAAAVAAGVAAALVIAPGSARSAGSPVASPRPAGKVVIHPFTGRLTAARFLDAAARAALQQPSVPPGPGQWVYSENSAADGKTLQSWLPANGSKPAFTIPGGYQPACSVAQAEAKGCLPDAGYFPDMPASPKQLFAYLAKINIAQPVPPGGKGFGASWVANDLGKGVMVLLEQTYLRPAQRAALYELMATTPGFRTVPGVRDATGRAGVGIEWTYEGGKAADIFDPRTFAYLGSRTWPAAGFHGPGAGQYDGLALTRLGVVSGPPPQYAAVVRAEYRAMAPARAMARARDRALGGHQPQSQGHPDDRPVRTVPLPAARGARFRQWYVSPRPAAGGSRLGSRPGCPITLVDLSHRWPLVRRDHGRCWSIRSSRRARSCSKSRARAAGGWMRPIRRASSATSDRTSGSASTLIPKASAAGLMS
jgi:hypothetical protein